MNIFKSKFGNTKLHIFIANNNSAELYRELDLVDNKKIFFLNCIDSIKNTLLHKASFHNNIEVCSYLIKAGHDLDCQNLNGQTPLHLAYMNNFESLINLLLESGSSIDIKDNNNLKPVEVKL